MPFGYAAAIAAVGSVASGVLGANAAGKAAGQEQKAADQASATELSMFDQSQQQLSPWINAGGNALNNLQKLLGIGPGGTGATSPLLQMLGIGTPGAPGTGNINPSTFQASPGFQYSLQQGTNAVTNNAHGNLGGNQLRALQATGQGLANQNFSNYLGNVGNAWNGLVGDVSGISSAGLGATENLAGIRTGVGNQVGANDIRSGDAAAAGTIGSANALQQMIKGLTSSATTGLTGGMGGGGAGGAGGGDSGGLLRAFLTMLQGSGGGGGGDFGSLGANY